MNEPLVYLAGPLFSDQDREMLLSIEKAFITAGLQCFLPHREVGDLSLLKAEIGEDPARRYVFDSDIRGVEDCAVVCALLDGTDVDSGTAAEMGYAHALGKPVFGLCTDHFRRGRTINNVIWGVCDGGKKIYTSIAEIVMSVMDSLLRSGHLNSVPLQASYSGAGAGRVSRFCPAAGESPSVLGSE
jgi:nucleoside 2-deoxyribosyltransferase